MNNISVKVFNDTFKLEKVTTETSKQLFVLLENNREDLFNFQLDMSLIESKNEFDELIKRSKEFFIISKNDQLIGCVYIKKWGIHDELSFWLDKDHRENKIFTELLSLFIKSYVYTNNVEIIIWAARNKAIVSKKLAKKLGFKTGFRYNSKMTEFDQKKVVPAVYFYKLYNTSIEQLLDTLEIKDNLLRDLETFCIDLADYTFKRNDFFINTDYGYYYWSGLDVSEDLKEVYFVNAAKAKSIYKKIIKKISNVEEYVNLYNSCKTFYIVYHSAFNSFSIMLLLPNKKTEWIHFNNAII